jgi:DNA-binding response OmpR family regulator
MGGDGRVTAGAAEKRRILLVDDEAAVGVFVAAMLQQAGFAVVWAKGCDHATEIFLERSGQIDLLVTDVTLGDGSGPLLAARLQGQAPGLAVLFISGHNTAELEEADRLPPRAAFLQKPFSGEELVEKVREVLDGTGSPSRA